MMHHALWHDAKHQLETIGWCRSQRLRRTGVYDFVVVGGGSAGCTVAGRLVASGARVLLLEAGPPDRHPLIHIPAGFTKLLATKLLYHYETAPQAALDGRRPILPQGRTLGGGSSVNALIYIRGQREDYDAWAAAGCDGWSYNEVLPYFKRAEDNERLSNVFHGNGGPLGVSDLRQICEISRAFVRAGQQAGIPFTPDFNGASQYGVGFNQVTTRNNRRCSAAVAYLPAARATGRLTVVTEALVQRVVLDGNRAVGVDYLHRGTKHEVRGVKEVVLSGGAIQTPKLMMLSGLGPALELARNGISCAKDLPGVGQNLQDHFEAGAIAFCDGPYGYFGQDTPLRALKNGLQYLAFGSGPVASNVTEACAFVNVDDPAQRPNVQMHFVPLVFIDKDDAQVKQAGATINMCVLRPESRGSLRLASTDAANAPVIDPAYLSSREDQRLSIKGLAKAREILMQPALRAFTKDSEAWPGPSVRTDAELLNYVRSYGKTVYHPVGTCQMGDGESAVVDPELRVKGITGLRVIDASVMPNLVSGNTNAPSIMIGEKGSDLILGRKLSAVPLPLSNANSGNASQHVQTP
jgi:choline dehydrogenase